MSTTFRWHLTVMGVALTGLLIAGCQTTRSLPGSAYYTQFAEVHGITIQAPEPVDPRAVEAAEEVVEGMLVSARPDIVERMRTRGAALAIIPKNEYITVLPEFANLSGRRDPNGNRYDSMAIRGAGAIPSQPVTATSEENLLGLRTDAFRAESVTVHEFAHAVQNLGFSKEDRVNWSAIYDNARRVNTFRRAFAMTNDNEYFAELSQSYFAVNSEIGGPEAIRRKDPDAFVFLEAVYGPL